jgi:sec-independent protein translocase protein TatA
MIGSLGTPELILILVVVLLVFGIGRVSKLGSELGKGVSSFRKGLREGQAELAEEEEKNGESEA